VPWSTPFEDPIILPNGRQLLTLKDAADFIMKLPKAEYTAPEWQAAMEALILVAETSGPTMLARIGVIPRRIWPAMPASSRPTPMTGIISSIWLGAILD
jgi:hypothetical protein